MREGGGGLAEGSTGAKACRPKQAKAVKGMPSFCFRGLFGSGTMGPFPVLSGLEGDDELLPGPLLVELFSRPAQLTSIW